MNAPFLAASGPYGQISAQGCEPPPFSSKSTSNDMSEMNPVPKFQGSNRFLTQNDITVDRQAEISRYPPTKPIPTFQTPSSHQATILHDDYRLPTLPNNNSTQNFIQNNPPSDENEHFLDAVAIDVLVFAASFMFVICCRCELRGCVAETVC